MRGVGRGGADVNLIASPFLWKFRGAVVRTPDSYARAQISVEPKLCFTFLLLSFLFLNSTAATRTP